MDDARLDLLVRTCWPRLVQTAYLLTGAAPAAEELVHDALRRRLAKERTETGLRDAVVREAFRHRALYEAGSAAFADLAGTETVRAVLRQLPLDERAVLVLRYRDGLSLEQVGDVLRVPDQGLAKRERRALRALREAGLVPSDGEPRPEELRAALDDVAAMPGNPPPDVAALLASRRGRLWPFC